AMLPLLDLLAVLLVLTLSPVVPERWPVLQELGLDLGLGLLIVGWLALFGGYDRPIRAGRPLKAMLCLFLSLLVAIAITGNWQENSIAIGRPFLGTALIFSAMRLL